MLSTAPCRSSQVFSGSGRFFSTQRRRPVFVLTPRAKRMRSRRMASPSSEATGAAPPSEDKGAASRGETPPPRYVTPPPRYVFGFSTGHVGTTSLSSRSMYECTCATRAHCKCELAGIGFFHETGRRRGLQETHPRLYEWHEASVSPGRRPATTTTLRKPLHECYCLHLLLVPLGTPAFTSGTKRR